MWASQVWNLAAVAAVADVCWTGILIHPIQDVVVEILSVITQYQVFVVFYLAKTWQPVTQILDLSILTN